MAFNRFCLMVLFAKPSAVELLTWMGVAGWGCLSLARVVQMGTASWSLRNLALISASAADDITLLMILDTLWMGPLRVGLVLGAWVGYG